MPLYDYMCPHGHVKEVSHSMSDTPEITCEECSESMTRQISAPRTITIAGQWSGNSAKEIKALEKQYK